MSADETKQNPDVESAAPEAETPEVEVEAAAPEAVEPEAVAEEAAPEARLSRKSRLPTRLRPWQRPSRPLPRLSRPAAPAAEEKKPAKKAAAKPAAKKAEKPAAKAAKPKAAAKAAHQEGRQGGPAPVKAERPPKPHHVREVHEPRHGDAGVATVDRCRRQAARGAPAQG